MQKEPMTSDNYDVLTSELSNMKLVLRPAILIEIEIARQQGDLKENAEYHAAREDKDNLDKRVAIIEDQISRAVIIDPSTLPHDRISFGSTIELIDLQDESSLFYTIVSTQDSDPTNDLISFNSPLAKQLLGQTQGDVVNIKLPNGIKNYEVESISYKKK